MGYSAYLYLVLVLPALLISLFAQAMVKTSYAKYSKQLTRTGLTGARAAQMVLNYYGITDVRIVPTSGKLTDNYNPKTKLINLSEGVFNGTSIAAIGVACHEAGHAAQHANGYLPIKIRNMLIPVCNIGSYAGIPIALIGYFLGFGDLIYIGLGLYAAITLFQLVTLPVELNASRRALKLIDEQGLLADDGERKGARKMLTAAAMTYVAALLSSLANLIRLAAMLLGGKRRR